MRCLTIALTMTSAAHLKSYDEIHAFLEKEFPILRGKTDKLEIDFEKLFMRMERRFDELDQKKADKTDVQRIYDMIDGPVKRIDEDYNERIAMISQLNRHDRWHHQTADHLGLKLN